LLAVHLAIIELLEMDDCNIQSFHGGGDDDDNDLNHLPHHLSWFLYISIGMYVMQVIIFIRASARRGAIAKF
jgi:hypothetical protein